MATKPRAFDTNQYFHIYNCGVEKRNIFEEESDFQRFLDAINFYLYKQRTCFAQYKSLEPKAKQVYEQINPRSIERLRVKLIAYCLMPNHYHFVLKPAKKDGITRFISDISNSHSRFFNTKYDRLGSLFQGTYKAKELPDEQSILNVTRYVHLNPSVSKKANPEVYLNPEDYLYSSYPVWISPTFQDTSGPDLAYSEIINFRNQVQGPKGYEQFVEAQLNKNPKLGIERLVIE
ncbi:MAG: transposase [Patescibacteria group bacterium]|nr:transposase [Patescibacteria group bacterium]